MLGVVLFSVFNCHGAFLSNPFIENSEFDRKL